MSRNWTLLFLIVLLSACDIASNKYEAAIAEALALQQKVDSLQTIINHLQKTPSTLLTEAGVKVKTGEYGEARHILIRFSQLNSTPKQKKDAARLLALSNTQIQEVAYQNTIASKNAESYKGFIKSYPKSKHSKKVTALIKVSPVAVNYTGDASISSTNNISGSINSSANTSSNWKSNGSAEHAKSYKQTTNYTTRVGAICGDGTRSYATGRGACSHHGGVSEWLYQ